MKKHTALYILAVALCIILAGYILHISAITNLVSSTLIMMQVPHVIVIASICAFVFINSKNYWLINAICAITLSLAIQYGLIGHGAGLYTILVRALAFMVIVYLLNLIRTIINK